MKQRRIFLSNNEEHLNALRAAEIRDTYALSDAGNFDLSNCEIVVVDYGDDAKDNALKLAERGVPQTSLSYIDLRPNELVTRREPKHLFWDDVIWLSEVEEEDFPTYPSGIDFLDINLGWRWRVPELVIIAGPYGCGKSTFGQYLAANFVNGVGRQFKSGAMLCSWEDLSSEVRRNIATFGRNHDATDLLNKIAFVRRDPNEDRFISWYIDLVRYHRKRYGTMFFFLDPWNEMDHQKAPMQNETEYTREIMKEFRRVVDVEQIILVIATHVSAKYIKGNGDIEPFKIGHAFGSSNFGAKADRGICLAQSKKWDSVNGHAIIRHDKSKIKRKMGKTGTVAARFDDRKFRYEYDSYVTEAVKDVWKD